MAWVQNESQGFTAVNSIPISPFAIYTILAHHHSDLPFYPLERTIGHGVGSLPNPRY
jgi:hypothetical protein